MSMWIPPTPRQPDCTNRASDHQCAYARHLGADPIYCRSLSVGDAREYIDARIEWNRANA